LVSHVNTKGWHEVTHYHTKSGSTASKDWGVSGVPHCILVDIHGKIVWRGHPQSINLENAISSLARGEEVSF
jgi:hypothetical protein